MEKYLTKKELEILFNRENGYYDSYCWFEDIICNVCGKLVMGGDDEWFLLEQDIDDTNEENVINFCSQCSKLPNRLEVAKIFNN